MERARTEDTRDLGRTIYLWGFPGLKTWAEWREDKKCLGGLMPEGKDSVPEGRSDRSQARSAWNSPTPKEPSRRARSDQSQTLSQRYFASKGAPCFLRKANHSNHRIGAHTGANQTVPYGTALLRWRCPRHFVPGYDRTVPPRQKAILHRS